MTIAAAPSRTSHRPPIQARHVAIASGHYLATEAGMRMYRLGGNAIDAGVAAGICIDVLLPDLCNFGGVAPTIVYHKASGDLVSISGLGCWGKSATLEHFIEHEGGEIPIGVKRSVVPGAPDAWLTALARYGKLSFAEVVQPAIELAEGGEIPVGVKRSVVPGAPDGWLTALARYGKLSFAEVVQPAIELAEGGFVVYPSLHRNLKKEEARLRGWDSTAAIFTPGGSVPQAGEVLYQRELANTFKQMIAAEERAGGGRAAKIEAARDEFYTGEIGKQIAAFIQDEGGFIGEQDLADFHSDVEPPSSTTYHDVEVYACGPWSQGPVNLQVLNIIEQFDLRSLGHNSADYIHLFAEAFNLAFSDRERFYGDPHFVDVPLATLLSKEYADTRRARIDFRRAFGEMPDAGEIGGYITYTDEVSALDLQPDTSYVCAVDEEGNAFSATPSDGVGSTPIVPGLGLVCSGRGSQTWLIPGHASSLEGGKRPRLTPNPAMAFKDGKLFMPFGTPGGDMQPQSMMQTFINMVEFGMDVQQAIEAPRFGTYSHPNSFWPHAYLPGRLTLEARISREVGEELAARGHDLEWWPEWTRVAGNVCAIRVDHERGTLEAGADARAEAYAAGW